MNGSIIHFQCLTPHYKFSYDSVKMDLWCMTNYDAFDVVVLKLEIVNVFEFNKYCTRSKNGGQGTFSLFSLKSIFIYEYHDL